MAGKKTRRGRSRVKRGTCRSCGCTDNRACPTGCYWIDSTHTRCSNCPKVRIVTEAERAAISELGEMAQLCYTSKSDAVKHLGILMAERAAMIVRGSSVYRWSNLDLQDFADVYRAHEPASFAPDRKRR